MLSCALALFLFKNQDALFCDVIAFSPSTRQ